jgi:hypothetical protein
VIFLNTTWPLGKGFPEEIARRLRLLYICERLFNLIFILFWDKVSASKIVYLTTNDLCDAWLPWPAWRITKNRNQKGLPFRSAHVGLKLPGCSCLAKIFLLLNGGYLSAPPSDPISERVFKVKLTVHLYRHTGWPGCWELNWKSQDLPYRCDAKFLTCEISDYCRAAHTQTMRMNDFGS